ncbi:uncharacterized protein LOC133734546 [Rosa rugosa]|uniref:uncharacterized protein LOC133734546 n=1 Tax=Rosa rugosa TaxID=74645 RepID=UPI002B4077CA|nr:uncharacterized protein LOC133734546 [Rosa rugosa]
MESYLDNDWNVKQDSSNCWKAVGRVVKKVARRVRRHGDLAKPAEDGKKKHQIRRKIHLAVLSSQRPARAAMQLIKDLAQGRTPETVRRRGPGLRSRSSSGHYSWPPSCERAQNRYGVEGVAGIDGSALSYES